MRRAMLALALLVAGCSSSGPSGGHGSGSGSASGGTGCAGTVTPGAVQVIESGPITLPGGGRAVVKSRPADDADGPRATLALLGTRAGEATAATVHVGTAVTVQGKQYHVVRICADAVSLVIAA